MPEPPDLGGLCRGQPASVARSTPAFDWQCLEGNRGHQTNCPESYSKPINECNQRVVKLIGKRGKTVGTQAPHTANANDQIGDRNKNIGAAASQAGRSLALT
jgi:hypothetical protein